MLDRRIDIRAGNRVIDKATHAVAPAQVLFGCARNSRRSFRQLVLLVSGQFQPQPVDDVLHNRVLDTDDVVGVGINTIAP